MKPGWTEVALGDVVTFRSGVGFPRELQGRAVGKLPVVKVSDVSRAAKGSGGKLLGAINYVGDGELPMAPVPAGSILFAKIGEAIRQNFRVLATTPTLMDNNVMAAVPCEHIDERYLLYWLRARDFYPLAAVTAVPALRPRVLERLRLPLPPLDEQRRIAHILDTAAALDGLSDRSTRLLQSARENLFLSAFGNVSGPSSGPIGTVDDIVSEVTYGTSTKGREAGPIPMLRMGNITTSGNLNLASLKYLDEDPGERFMVQFGDVLFNRTNSKELVGKTAVFDRPDPMAYAGYLIRVRMADGHSPHYLAGFLNSGYGKAVLRGMAKNIVGMANINAKELRAIKIPIPSADAQRDYATRLLRVQEQGALVADRSAMLQTFGHSLRERAFAGEL